jgi:hypothetical protein
VGLEVRWRNGDRGVAMNLQRRGERQSGVGESLTTVAGRGGLLLQTDSERIRCTGQRTWPSSWRTCMRPATRHRLSDT